MDNVFSNKTINLKGGTVINVTNVEQARIAEEAGASAVAVVIEHASVIKSQSCVARMADPKIIKEIKQVIDIPVIGKVRIGHFVEAAIVESLGVDYINESEVLTPADNLHFIDKHQFTTPFICGAFSIYEAMRRIDEGASILLIRGNAGSGDISSSVNTIRSFGIGVQKIQNKLEGDLYYFANHIGVSFNTIKYVHDYGKLPVPCFSAGGISTPADAAMMMQLGADGVFLGSGVFNAEYPVRRAHAIVEAVKHYDDPAFLATQSEDIGRAYLGPDAIV